MEGINYYKSLVTDEEVIKALLKESKAREGELEKTRVRPNLNFFQRTVSNLMSTNRRISTRQHELVAKEKMKNRNDRPRKQPVRRKTQLELVREILTKRIEFVKSSESSDRLDFKHTKSGTLKDDRLELRSYTCTEPVSSLEKDIQTHPSSTNMTEKSKSDRTEQIETNPKNIECNNSDIDVISLSDTDSNHSSIIDVGKTINILDSSSESEKNYRALKRRKRIKKCRCMKNR